MGVHSFQSDAENNAAQFYCSKCGRVTTRYSKDFRLWLVAFRVDDPAKLVVRCPQHITERTIRYAGRKRTMAMYKWAKQAKTKDPYPESTFDIATPAPITETELLAFYERGKLAPALRRLSGVTIKQNKANKAKKRTL